MAQKQATQKTLQERILLACHGYFESAPDNLQKFGERGFKSYISKENVIATLLRRSSNQDSLSTQWSNKAVAEGDKQRSFCKFLVNGEVSSEPVNDLIKKMKQIDRSVPQDFEVACEEVIQLQDEVKDFIVTESMRQAKRILEQPSFFQQREMRLAAFKTDQEKGLLTRLREGDPDLKVIKPDNVEPRDWREMLLRLIDAYLFPTGSLVAPSTISTRLRDETLSSALKLPQDGLAFTSNALLIQRKMNQIVQAVQTDPTMAQFLRGECMLGLSPFSNQLKHALQGCAHLLNAYEADPAQSKRAQISALLKNLSQRNTFEWANSNASAKGWLGWEPKKASDVLKLAQASQEQAFHGAGHLMAALTGQDLVSDFDADPWRPHDDQATSLESVFAVFYCLQRISVYQRLQRKNCTKKDLFMTGLVIDQSSQTYSLLLTLLTQTQKIMSTLKADAEKNPETGYPNEWEIALGLFDGLCVILLANLQALYESESRYVDYVFETPVHGAQSQQAKDYVSKEWLPAMRKLIEWRAEDPCTKTRLVGQQKAGDLAWSEWQATWKKVLVSPDDQDANSLTNQVEVSEKSLEEVLASLDLEKTAENKDEFKLKYKKASEFTRAAIESKSPLSSRVILESFKRMVTMTSEEADKKTVCTKLAMQLKAMLYLASDNTASKINTVVQDLLLSEAPGALAIKENKFTASLIKMLLADSVSTLQDVHEVGIDVKESTRVNWKTKSKQEKLHGSDGGTKFEDSNLVKVAAEDFTLPRIREIGIHKTTFVLGLSVFYTDGTSYERKGSSNDNSTYESLILAPDEHICRVVGRCGCWTDQLTIYTNKGRMLRCGGEGGNAKDPNYPRNCYVYAFDTQFHHHLTKTDIHFVDLDEVPLKREDPLVSLILESELLSKGIEQKYVNSFTADSLAKIKQMQASIGQEIVADHVTSVHKSSQEEATGQGQDSALTLISTMQGQVTLNAVDHGADEEGDLLSQVIHAGQSELFDDFTAVLQLLLRESREPIRDQRLIMREHGMQVTRACFAVIVKLAGLTDKLASVLQSLELQSGDFYAESEAEKHKLMKEAAKQDKDVPLLLKEWCNATKMRRWLKETMTQNFDIDSEADQKKLRDTVAQVVDKAQFLIKLEKPAVFQSLEPAQDLLNELSYRIPSYARDNLKDEEEGAALLAEESDEEVKEAKPTGKLEDWREHFKHWKSNLKSEGAIRSQKQKLHEVRQVGTSAILVCLQHTKIKADTLLNIVQTNFMNSCQRLVGLQLLEQALNLITLTCDTKSDTQTRPSRKQLVQIRSVAAALNKGLRQASIDSKTCHYLDGIKSCGDHLEGLIRQSFFNVVGALTRQPYLGCADKNWLLELISCLDWNFKARDFEALLDLKVFKLLHYGVPTTLESREAEESKDGASPAKKSNIVLEMHQLHPTHKLTNELQVIASNLYLSIVSRLAEPEARKIIFDKSEKEAHGVQSLTRASSVVNVNAAQALLGMEFSIMFREFHEFTLVASRLSKYLSFENIRDFYGNGESQQYLESKLPTLISQVMTKIIQNAPAETYDKVKSDQQEESKAVSTEDVQVTMIDTTQSAAADSQTPATAESSQPKKVFHSPFKYTPEQIEVLEFLDSGYELSQEQSRIHDEIIANQASDTFGGMFDEPEEEAEEVALVQQKSVRQLERGDRDVIPSRHKMIHMFRDFKERMLIGRYLNQVLIFVKIATKAPYPLEMLQNVANPYHIKTLLKMLFQVSIEHKLTILTIFQTLLRIQVPLSIFDEGVASMQVSFRSELSAPMSGFLSKSAFSKFMFKAALQVQNSSWDSIFRETEPQHMHDVGVQLTRIVALCLKIAQKAEDSDVIANEDLSQAVKLLAKGDLPRHEVMTILQILEATPSLPVVGDLVYSQPKKDEEELSQVAQIVTWPKRKDYLDRAKFGSRTLILPQFVPDSQVPLIISSEAIGAVASRVQAIGASLENDEETKSTSIIEVVCLLKLLILQKSKPGFDSLLTAEHRFQLLRSLTKFDAFSNANKFQKPNSDQKTAITSQIESYLASSLRKQADAQFKTSGVDLFESEAQASNSSTTHEAKTADMVKQQSAPKRKATLKNKNSAAHKYQKDLLKSVKKKKTDQPAAANVKNNVLNSLFKDVFASVEEIIEMNGAVADFCRFAGCSLFEVLYGINQVLPADKRHFDTSELVEMYVELLTQLTDSSNDEAKEREIEGALIEQITKKLEKILSLFKPDAFKAEVLAKVDVQAAIEEVEATTLGLSNLLGSKARDRLLESSDSYSAFESKLQLMGELGDYSGQECSSYLDKQFFSKDFTVSARLLANRFAEKLVFALFDASDDTHTDEPEETKDIADVIASSQHNKEKKLYRTSFIEVEQGLKIYAKSVDLLEVGNGIECAWEAAFSDEFLTVSKLSADFSSLRELEDVAITRDMISLQSPARLAQQAEQMFRVQNVATPEGFKLVAYLVKSVLDSIFDDLGFMVNEKRHKTTLVDTLTKSAPQPATQILYYVTRLHLLVDLVLRHSQDAGKLLSRFASDLLSLCLYTMMHINCHVIHRRLLLERAFEIVRAVSQRISQSEDSVFEEFIESGTWEKMVTSKPLSEALTVTSKRFASTVNYKKSCFDYLIVELLQEMEQIDRKLFALLPQGSYAPLTFQVTQNCKDFKRAYKTYVSRTLDSSDLETAMLNTCLDDPKHKSLFDKTLQFHALNASYSNRQAKIVNHGFFDGAELTFKVQAQFELESDKLPDNLPFDLIVTTTVGDSVTETKQLRLSKQEPLTEPLICQEGTVSVECSYVDKLSNVKGVGHEGNFPQLGKDVLEVHYSGCGKFVYAVTASQIFKVSKNGAYETLALPSDLRFDEQDRVAKIEDLAGKEIIYTARGHVVAVGGNQPFVELLNNANYAKAAVGGKVRAYITTQGQFYARGLDVAGNKNQDMNSPGAIDEAIEPRALDLVTNIEGYLPYDKVVDIQVCATEKPETDYAVITLERDGKRLLFSKGKTEKNVMGREAASDLGNSRFQAMRNQTNSTDFVQVFLYPSVSFAIGRNGKLWVLGGRLALEDCILFPQNIGEAFFRGPTQSNVTRFLRATIEGARKVKIEDIVYTEQIILLTVTVEKEGGVSEVQRHALIVTEAEAEGQNQGRKSYKHQDVSQVAKPFIFNGKLWSINEPQGAADNQPKLPPVVLEVTARPCLRNTQNITPQMLASIDPESSLACQLNHVRKVAKNENLINKVFTAMNNYVRTILSNRLPSQDDLKKMVNDACAAEKQVGEYNPIQCWNDQDSKEDIQLIVKAIAQINKAGMGGDGNGIYENVRSVILEDPLQENSLLKRRLDQSVSPASLNLCLRFCLANLFKLNRLQDQGFSKAKKPAKCTESRVQVSFFRFKASEFGISGKVDDGKGDTLFTQLFDEMKSQERSRYKDWWRREGGDDRVFRANFKGESSIDAGGPYRETMECISRELTSSTLPILIPSANQRDNHGYLRECFVLNHQASSEANLEQLMHFGLIIGFAARSMQTWNINLHPIVWKAIVQLPLDPDTDLESSDKHMHQTFQHFRQLAEMSQTEEEFQMGISEQNFTVDWGQGETEVTPGGKQMAVTRKNLESYIRLASLKLLNKAALQTEYFLKGVYHVSSKQSFQMLSWRNAEIRAMGEPIIDMGVLRKFTRNNWGEQEHIEWFWQILNEMDEFDKQKYLRFVFGRAKLPSNPEEGRRHEINRSHANDAKLPMSHTCFFQIDLPKYSSKAIMQDRLLTAIRFCGEIDTD